LIHFVFHQYIGAADIKKNLRNFKNHRIFVILRLVVLPAQFQQYICATAPCQLHQYCSGTYMAAPLVLVQTYGQIDIVVSPLNKMVLQC